MQPPYTVEQLKLALMPVFNKNNVRRATLFGSYAKGKATPRSDVDLLVDSGLHGMQFFGLLEDVCNSLECDVDLIDVQDKYTGKLHPEATEAGIDFGLYMQERTSTYGQSYQIVMYSQKAQEFIASHLEQIVNNSI